MKKLIVAAIAMALSAPVWAQDLGPQPAGEKAGLFSQINTGAIVYSGVAAAAVVYALCDKGHSGKGDAGTGGTGGGGGTGGTGGTTGTSGTSGTSGTGG